MDNTAAGDQWLDPALPQQSAALVAVVPSVGEESLRLVSGASAPASDPGYRVQERDQLCDVMPISAGQGDGKRGAVAVDDQMVLGAREAATSYEPDWTPRPHQGLMAIAEQFAPHRRRSAAAVIELAAQEFPDFDDVIMQLCR